MKIAILIKPTYLINQKIINIKKNFKNNFLKCLYIDDFPHITLLTINTNINTRLLKKIEIPINLQKIKISIGNPGIFPNDKLTNGKTYYFKIKKNINLFKLQLIISKYFKPYINKTKKGNIFPKNSNESKSFKMYGFPYVGTHWIPHITICSVLDKVISNKSEVLFLKKKINLNFLANEILICKISSRNLKILKKIKFIN